MEETRDARIAELPESVRSKIKIIENKKARKREEKYMMENPAARDKNPNLEKKLFDMEKIPSHPLLNNLEDKGLSELLHIADYFSKKRFPRQRNSQLMQIVEAEITILPGAKLGNREIRLITKRGLSNPLIFQVDDLPETKELEPNNNSANQKYPGILNLPEYITDKSVMLPVIINGQIMPGDIDRFCFAAKKGEKITVKVFARELIPYLADAVPGWFQPVVTVYNSSGEKIFFCDDYYFNPDPVFSFEIPSAGKYEIEIRDAIFRGRKDFVYRIKISDEPIENIPFPLAQNTKMKISERQEKEKNNTTTSAQKVQVPSIINGQIEKPGDVDIFKISARSGEEIVAEVKARALGSPLDSFLQIIDFDGRILKQNDDFIEKDKFLHISETGLITHHSDSYLKAKIPKDGIYYLKIRDIQNNGGKDYPYKLRISNPMPDYTLLSTKSTLNIISGTTIPLKIYVVRKDGFNGPIRIFSRSRAIKVSGGILPKGTNCVTVTLTSRPKRKDEIIPVNLFGIARIGNSNVIHKIVPADNVMQAFLYRHLVPREKFLLYKHGSKWIFPVINLTNNIPLVVKKGENIKLFYKFKANKKFLKGLEVKPVNLPDGFAVKDINLTPDGCSIELTTDVQKLKHGYTDNIIFSCFRKMKTRRKTQEINIETFPAVQIYIAN